MSKGYANISAISDFIFGKTKYKSNAKCEQHLKHVPIYDMP